MAKEFSPDPIRDYLRVSSNSDQFEPLNIEQFTPQPTREDRQYGEIERFFVRFITHKSSSDIVEVDKSTYTKVQTNPFYQSVSVRWKISGPLDDLTQQGPPVRFMPGIISANQKSVEINDVNLPGLKNYITDYKRFWKF